MRPIGPRASSNSFSPASITTSADRYEQAINIWTRVAFLERGHGRARAYIERARGALAERQRESEELTHTGIAAYEAGDLQTARELLTRAVEQGGGQ